MSVVKRRVREFALFLGFDHLGWGKEGGFGFRGYPPMFPLEEGFGETWFPNFCDSAKRHFDCGALLCLKVPEVLEFAWLKANVLSAGSCLDPSGIPNAQTTIRCRPSGQRTL